MWQSIKNITAYLVSSFHGSEVLIWSRLNIALGSAWLALQGVDISPLVHDPKLLVYWVIFSNFVNEMLRKRRAEYDDNGNMK